MFYITLCVDSDVLVCCIHVVHRLHSSVYCILVKLVELVFTPNSKMFILGAEVCRTRSMSHGIFQKMMLSVCSTSSV